MEENTEINKENKIVNGLKEAAQKHEKNVWDWLFDLGERTDGLFNWDFDFRFDLPEFDFGLFPNKNEGKD